MGPDRKQPGHAIGVRPAHVTRVEKQPLLAVVSLPRLHELVDTDRRGNELLNHKVFLSVGHDEYWSGAQRANIAAARDAGVNLQFLTGNEGYWKTRYENSVDGSSTAYDKESAEVAYTFRATVERPGTTTSRLVSGAGDWVV